MGLNVGEYVSFLENVIPFIYAIIYFQHHPGQHLKHATWTILDKFSNVVANDSGVLLNNTISYSPDGNYSLESTANVLSGATVQTLNCTGSMSNLNGCNGTDVVTVDLQCNSTEEGRPKMLHGFTARGSTESTNL